MSKILVTGGAGFIGSHVCDHLLKRSDKVICVDNFNDYYDPSIKRRNIEEAIKNPNFSQYNVDISNLDALKKIFESNKIDAIIHLAARAGVRPSLKDPILYEESNIKGTINILELAKEFGIKNIVFASSSSVYGSRNTAPFKETEPVDKPISVYAATKRAGELLCYTYHSLYGMSISCLRFFTVYGPRGRPDMMPLKFTKLIDQDKEIELYGNGLDKRDFTFIDDIVKGTIAASDKNNGYEIFNLGNSNPVDVIYFVSLLEKELGKKAKKVHGPSQLGDVPLTCADITKAQNMLGYKPSVSLEQGVKQFVDWYRKTK